MGAHWSNGAFRPRHDKPTTDPGYWRDGQRRRKSRRSGSGGGIGAAWPLIGLCSVAMFWGVWTLTPALTTTGSMSLASVSDSESASFGLCHSGGGYNCVVDGDTLYYKGTKIRIADIDTPETHDAMCESEAQRGNAATGRLHALVNAGSFTLAPNPDGRDEDRYGRKLRIVTRGGESLGGVLVDEGLARWYRRGAGVVLIKLG